jgi:hypothetical protein
VSAEDGQDLVRIEGPFAVAPPPGFEQGPHRFVLAANAPIAFPHEGRYRLVGSVEGGPTRTVDFWVHDRAPEAAAPPAEPDAGQGPSYGYL